MQTAEIATSIAWTWVWRTQPTWELLEWWRPCQRAGRPASSSLRTICGKAKGMETIGLLAVSHSGADSGYCPKRGGSVYWKTENLNDDRDGLRIPLNSTNGQFKTHVKGCLAGSVGWVSDFSSGHDLEVHEFKPGIRLCADNVEPAWESLSPSFSAPPLLFLSLFQNKYIKIKKKKTYVKTERPQTQINL